MNHYKPALTILLAALTAVLAVSCEPNTEPDVPVASIISETVTTTPPDQTSTTAPPATIAPTLAPAPAPAETTPDPEPIQVDTDEQTKQAGAALLAMMSIPERPDISQDIQNLTATRADTLGESICDSFSDVNTYSELGLFVMVLSGGFTESDHFGELDNNEATLLIGSFLHAYCPEIAERVSNISV